MKIFIALVTLTAAVGAIAQNSFTLEKDITTFRFLDRIKPDRISHFNIFNGPALSGDTSDPFDAEGVRDEGGISGWHQISFQYQLTKKTRFVINPRFTTTYNSREANNGRPAAEWANPVLGITSTWYQNGNFSFSGGLNTSFLNATESTQEDQLLINPGGFNAVNYQVNSRFNVGSWLWGRYQIYQNRDEYDALPIFVAPYVTYAFNDKFTVQPFWQYNGNIERSDKVNIDTDDHFNVLFSYRISKQINLQPIITVFRAQEFNLAKGNLNLWLSGAF